MQDKESLSAISAEATRPTLGTEDKVKHLKATL